MTEVTLKFTGFVRKRMGTGRMTFVFEGDTLGDLLEAVLDRHDIRDLLIDETGGIRAHSRVVVNGRFSYLLGGMEAALKDGDVVVLMRPYAVAF
jgi:molybdopterin converting factor small subunit